MAGRTIALGDVHGCRAALAAILDAMALTVDDTLIVLGDFIDRGPDSRGVIEDLMQVERTCRLVRLRGNHEEMMLSARADDGTSGATRMWLQYGGAETLRSYGTKNDLAAIPEEHWEFVRTCTLVHETESHFFVHGNYIAGVPLDGQDPRIMLWMSLKSYVPGPHVSGKTAVVGHTPQSDVLHLGHLIAIDTGCYKGGWLTALDLTHGARWQAKATGKLRSS